MSDDNPARRALRQQSKAHPVARDAIEAMKGQLLIVLVERLGGEITIPVAEIDATGDRNLSMQLNREEGSFTFKVAAK